MSLNQARVQHDGGMFLVKVDPLLENSRTEPQFKDVLRQVNLLAHARVHYLVAAQSPAAGSP